MIADTRTASTIRLEASGSVLHITLHRPEVRNAMSLAMVLDLTAALKAAEVDGIRIVVLRGSSGHFCAGADLKDMAAARAAPVVGAPDPIAKFNAAIGHLCAAYARTPLAVVAVLEGTVMGGGFGLACTADVAIAGPTVDFRLPETSLGLIPAQVAPFLVERVGYSEAKRLSITGARFGAAEALRIGLVHRVCEGADALNDAVASVAAEILACAPGAIAQTKALLQRARFEDASNLVDDAALIFAVASRGEEGSEGLRAFMEKRKPAWARK